MKNEHTSALCPACGSDCNERDELEKAEREINRLRAAPQQAEPVWVRPDQLQKARQAPFLCRVSPTKDAPDLMPMFLHPPAAEVQQAEPVAWGQLGMMNGKTYLRQKYDREPYPPPPDVVRNLNLVPLWTNPPAAEVQRLRDALAGLLEHYVLLVNSGDAGSWDPEVEPVVIASRSALDKA